MGTQQFCLRWNNHQTNMLNVFDQLLQNGDFVDVTLACEGVSIKAHKMVLSACSPYFQNLFKDNPCQHPIVILKDMRYTELRSIVDFMYKGEINVSQDQLTTLLKTAETLKVKGLAEVSSGSVPNSQGEALGVSPEDPSTIPQQSIESPLQQVQPPPQQQQQQQQQLQQQQSLPQDGRTSPPSKRKRHRPARRPSNGEEQIANEVPRDVDSVPLPKSEPIDLLAEPPVELLMSADGHYKMESSVLEHDRSRESVDRESGLSSGSVGMMSGGSPQPSTSRTPSSTQENKCALGAYDGPCRKKLKTNSVGGESESLGGHEETLVYDWNSTERQVEIHPNSGVTCSESVWTAAQSCPSATCFTRLLLVNMFDMETLVSSNLRGGTSKRPNLCKTERKALDPVRIEAIMEAAIAKYGTNVTKSRLGMTINNKITELRNKFKGRPNRKKD